MKNYKCYTCGKIFHRQDNICPNCGKQCKEFLSSKDTEAYIKVFISDIIIKHGNEKAWKMIENLKSPISRIKYRKIYNSINDK